MLLIYPEPVELIFFEERNQFHQENASSPFTRNLFCSLPSSTHRKSLVNNKYTCVSNSGKIKRYVKDVDLLFSLLTEQLNIQIDLKIAEAIFYKIKKAS